MLCNGCYGRLLALHDIRAGTTGDDAIADALAEQLLKLASADDQRIAVERLKLRDRRIEVLSDRSSRLLATADFVAGELAHTTGMDWSAAVIGPCKAFEVELVGRLVGPLAVRCAGLDLSVDIQDKDLGRVAKFCAAPSTKAPEIGAVRHFLQTAANSRTRQSTSVLLGVLLDLTREWPRADWLLDAHGALDGMNVLTGTFRNRAAHTDELTRDDYEACAAHVIGPEGILWKLIEATSYAR